MLNRETRVYAGTNTYNARKATVEEPTNKRALERSRKRNGVQDIDPPSLEERARRIEHGPPLFNVGDVVTIMKDVIFLGRFLAMTALDRFPVNT